MQFSDVFETIMLVFGFRASNLLAFLHTEAHIQHNAGLKEKA